MSDSYVMDEERTLEGLVQLKPVEEGGIHTAGNSSQVSDGAAGLLYMSAERAQALGLRPRARIKHDVVVGSDPYFLLEGPIDATRRILDRSGMSLRDIDLFEFSSQCVLSSQFNHTPID